MIRSTRLFTTVRSQRKSFLKSVKFEVICKRAIEWIMEWYQITVNKDSGIKNDPNDWAPENPKYILDLLLSVVRVSVETVEVVKGLPKLKFEN